ncbi:MAG: hypothetical protein ACXAEU_21025 [Candidatus Hodarchaeales archaeon]
MEKTNKEAALLDIIQTLVADNMFLVLTVNDIYSKLMDVSAQLHFKIIDKECVKKSKREIDVRMQRMFMSLTKFESELSK